MALYEVDVGLVEDSCPLEGCLVLVSVTFTKGDTSDLRHVVFDKLCNGSIWLQAAFLC